MKSKFENDLKNKAYESVPDRWEEVKKEASESIPEKPIKLKKNVNYKQIVAAAASLIVVIGCGVGVKAISGTKTGSQAADNCYDRDAMEVTKVLVTDENGEVCEVDGYIAYDEESTVILDENGEVIAEEEAVDENGTVVICSGVQTTKSQADKSDEEYDEIQATNSYVLTTTAAETAVEKSWNNRTEPQKFPALKIGSTEYSYMGTISTRSASLDSSGVTLSNYDNSDKLQNVKADVYTFSGFSKKLAVGVKFSQSQQYPYVYVNTSYRAATLGEFLDDLDFKNSVTYGNIDYGTIGQFPVGAVNVNKYLLTDRSLRNQDLTPGGKFVTVTINLNELGFDNKVLYIYENGYISTNLTGIRHTFFVGKAAVADFLKASNNITFGEINVTNPYVGTSADYIRNSVPYTTEE